MEAANRPVLSETHTNAPDHPIPPMGAIDDVDNYGLQVTALKTAMELDVFDAIAKGQNTVESIATKTQCSVHGMGVLLDALCALKLLQKLTKTISLLPRHRSILSAAAQLTVPQYTSHG